LPIDLAKADAATAAAEQALQDAQKAKDEAELQFLDSCTRLSQISEGRTAQDAARLKSRFIGAFGLPRWTRLCADSRK